VPRAPDRETPLMPWKRRIVRLADGAASSRLCKRVGDAPGRTARRDRRPRHGACSAVRHGSDDAGVDGASLRRGL